jgi:hypothetical protein
LLTNISLVTTGVRGEFWRERGVIGPAMRNNSGHPRPIPAYEARPGGSEPLGCIASWRCQIAQLHLYHVRAPVR